jgi:hypothetical protein
MTAPIAVRDVAAAAAIDAVPALWSGPRRHPVEPMPPLRPRPGVPFPWLAAPGRTVVTVTLTALIKVISY